jgi:mono/diheme cytochrome c family protein
MNIYQQNCAGCHGDIQHVHSPIGDSFYPRVPQFIDDAPDMSENQNYYITKHGIRLSGMPAWGKALNERQIWQVTTFLSHIDKLPPQLSAAWKAAADNSAVGYESDAGSKMEK